MQAPGRPDEDRRGGFGHGGWAGRYMDPVLGSMAGQGMAKTRALGFQAADLRGLLLVLAQLGPGTVSGVLRSGRRAAAEALGRSDA